MDDTKTTPDLNSDEIFPLVEGLIDKIVCAPAHLTDEEISNQVSREHPPGTSRNRWEVVSKEAARDHPSWSELTGGHATPRAPCPDCKSRVHVLMHC